MQEVISVFLFWLESQRMGNIFTLNASVIVSIERKLSSIRVQILTILFGTFFKLGDRWEYLVPQEILLASVITYFGKLSPEVIITYGGPPEQSRSTLEQFDAEQCIVF